MHFAKGHGTGNDFVLLPDPDARLRLTPHFVACLCNRRTGIGGDGMLRAVKTEALRHGEPGLAEMSAGADYFMDYHNADGSLAEMCGNGVRVFARYLVWRGWAPPGRQRIGTRAGVREVHAPISGDVVVNMGLPVLDAGCPVEVTVADRTYLGLPVSLGNPHLVCEVQDLAEVGDLRDAPQVAGDRFDNGVNVEFVRRLGPNALEMRVHERGVGETLSCGTGACAAAVAIAPGAGGPTWTVSVPGGDLSVRWAPQAVYLGGPATIVAEGTLTPEWTSE